MGKREQLFKKDRGLSDNKTGWLVWNPFQVLQFEELFRRFPIAEYIVIDQGKNLHLFDPAFLQRHDVRIIKKTEVRLVDGCYDVLLFQSPFPQIERLVRTPLVSVQYGLAKERHNYGEWRALADLNLMYGPYSAEKTAHFSPSVAIGNPKFASWKVENSKSARDAICENLGVPSRKKNILYMPTYGDLGSFDALVGPLGKLTDQFNVLIKMHHNNDRNDPEWLRRATVHGHKFLYDGGADQKELLSIADAVISDFSGAIFDAIYGRVPVILYQEFAKDYSGPQKFDLSSIEFRRRDEIGLTAQTIDELVSHVRSAIADPNPIVTRAEKLRNELFLDSSEVDTVGLAVEHINALLAGDIPPLTSAQVVVRETVRALRSREVQVRALRKGSAMARLIKWVGRKA